MSLTHQEIAQFQRDGFIIKKNFITHEQCEQLKALTLEHLERAIQPVEYEADVNYPGSPSSIEDEGGRTIRRLLGAYDRDRLYSMVATDQEIVQSLQQLFGQNELVLSRCHHNCVMTKQPRYSSVTNWHQDNRYWSFDENNLISVWTALGNETKDNGCLRVIPGSHQMKFHAEQLDERLFLKTHLTENKDLLKQRQVVELKPGDVLFFHSKIFHAAGKNNTQEMKFSLVFTYHEATNQPLENSRSDRFAGVPIA